jgi:hypothetical protein
MASATRMDAMLRGQSALAQKVFSVLQDEKLLDLHMLKRKLEEAELVGNIEQPKLLACVSALKDAKLVSEPKSGQYKRRGKPGRKPVQQVEQGMLVPQAPEPMTVTSWAKAHAPVEAPTPAPVEAPAPVEPEAVVEAVAEAPAPVEAPAPAEAQAPATVDVVAGAVTDTQAAVTDTTPVEAFDVLLELATELQTLGEEFNTRLKAIATRIEEAALLREDSAEQAAKLRKLQDFMRTL